MKPEPDHELLDEVFAEAATGQFRQRLLDTTLQAARQRRRTRHAGCGIAIAAIAVLAVLAIGPFMRAPTPALAAKTTTSRLQIVRSQPLPISAMVETKPGIVRQITSSSQLFVLVETGATKNPVKEINDDQLLALSSGRPVALLRDSDHAARLLFLDGAPDDGSKASRQ